MHLLNDSIGPLHAPDPPPSAPLAVTASLGAPAHPEARPPADCPSPTLVGATSLFTPINLRDPVLASGAAEMDLPLARITADRAILCRAQVDPNTIREYRALLTQGVRPPRLIVFEDGSENWLVEGFYWREAMEEAGWLTAPCLVYPGSREHAVVSAAQANFDPTLKRTQKDKRKAVHAVLTQLPNWTDREIGRWCKVSGALVAACRKEREETPAPQERTYSRKGKVGQMRIGNIGKSPLPQSGPKPRNLNQDLKIDFARQGPSYTLPKEGLVGTNPHIPWAALLQIRDPHFSCPSSPRPPRGTAARGALSRVYELIGAADSIAVLNDTMLAFCDEEEIQDLLRHISRIRRALVIDRRASTLDPPGGQ
jgi:hypothetical protein